jgi:hypothetical protein
MSANRPDHGKSFSPAAEGFLERVQGHRGPLDWTIRIIKLGSTPLQEINRAELRASILLCNPGPKQPFEELS